MKTDSKPTIVFLILVALAVWAMNFRSIFEISGDESAPVRSVAGEGSDIDIHERTRILAQQQPREQTKAIWDPFRSTPLVEEVPKKEPVPAPKPAPKKNTPPPVPAKPAPAPFTIQYVGYLEGKDQEIFILKNNNELVFHRLEDWVGRWQLMEADEMRLLFKDDNAYERELPR